MRIVIIIRSNGSQNTLSDFLTLEITQQNDNIPQMRVLPVNSTENIFAVPHLLVIY